MYAGFGGFAVGAGQVAVLAVEYDGDAGVPVLHHLQAAMDLAAQVFGGEVVAGEDGAHAARHPRCYRTGSPMKLRLTVGENAARVGRIQQPCSLKSASGAAVIAHIIPRSSGPVPAAASAR